MPIFLTVLISFTVHYLLILGAGALCDVSLSVTRAMLGATLAGLHAFLALLSGFSFLGGSLWRLLSLPLMGLAAFGRSHRKAVGYLCLLCLALDGLISNVKGSVIGAVALLGLCLVLRRRAGRWVPVTVEYGDRQLHLTALRDTGNTLRDPVTGGAVLVLGPEIAEKLTGLTRAQIRNPLESLEKLPGLRLIPYQAVSGRGFMLGMRIPKVKIGSWQGSHIVAFAPEGPLSKEGYQALVGGTL